LALSLEHYGPHRGLVLFRKHANRYLSPYPLPGELRQRLLTTTDAPAFLGLLDQILEHGNLEKEPQMHSDEHRYVIGQQ
jgi:tRNA-dihydrouridine synthase